MQIGFVGIGQMGLPLSTNLVKADFAVHAFDTNPAAVQALVAQGAQAAASLPELAVQTDVVITTLPAPHISEAVIAGPGGLLEGARQGSVFVEMSTVSPGVILVCFLKRIVNRYYAV
jgi:2-hydroxy-3-oxopropionate reductase